MEDKEENGLVTGQIEPVNPDQVLNPEQKQEKELVVTENKDTAVEKTVIPENTEKGKRPSAKEFAKKVVDEFLEEKKAKREFLKQYMERYPDNKTFHVTSDNMVFLEKDLSLARLHQKSLQSGSVTSITVNK